MVSISTAEEIKVYDNIIHDQPEFTFYSGIITNLGPQTKLNQLNQEQRIVADKQFRKQTLPWLLALARIEVASTMSMYGTAESPFDEFAPKFGLAEYRQILFDDVAAHLNALRTDEKFRQVSKVSPEADSDTIAYLRRLKLVDDMLKPVTHSNEPAIYDTAVTYRKEIKKFGKRLLAKVRAATFEYQETVANSNTNEQNINATQLNMVRSGSPLYRACVNAFGGE